MKELFDNFTETVMGIIVGMFVTGLWGFRELTHSQRYSDVKVKLMELETDLNDLQNEHDVIVERVNNIYTKQREIGDDVKSILKTVTELNAIKQYQEKETK